MAALTAVTPTRAGALHAAGSVAASDTIAKSILGTRGAVLQIINGNASDDTVTISDAGATPAGSTLTGGTYSATVAAGTTRSFKIHPSQANPATGLVTVTHSVTATVTYRLMPLS